MLVTLTEGRQRIGVSKDVFRGLIREGRFTVYANPRDRRSKLVDTEELDAYLTPQVIRERRPEPKLDGTRNRTGSM